MVSIITEITTPSLTLSYQGYNIGTDYQQLAAPSEGIAWANCLDWVSLDSYPTEQQMIDWENARIAAENANDAASLATQGLADKKALAEGLATEIVGCFNLVLEQTETSTIISTRYSNLRAYMDAQVSSFKNKFNADLLVEQELDASLISTDSEKATYCRYLRQWVTMLTVLLKSNF